jgi:hypothetical protein
MCGMLFEMYANMYGSCEQERLHLDRYLGMYISPQTRVFILIEVCRVLSLLYANNNRVIHLL